MAGGIGGQEVWAVVAVGLERRGSCKTIYFHFDGKGSEVFLFLVFDVAVGVTQASAGARMFPDPPPDCGQFDALY